MAGNRRVLIIGAGFCGLAAAMELARNKVPFVLVERREKVGGLSPTLTLGGQAFELGPHIYFDKDPEVTAFWTGLVGERLRTYERRTRLFYAGRYIKSPLSPRDVLVKLGPVAVSRILFSFLGAKLRRREVHNAEDWVITNFGEELYQHFFRVYNEKIWGLPCAEIAPDWAGQRIRSSLVSMVYRSLRRDPSFIVRTFAFPDGGSAAIAAAQEAAIRASGIGELWLGVAPTSITRNAGDFVVAFGADAATERFTHVISTIHLADLCEILTYEGRDEALLRAHLSRLVYRDLILVNLVFPPDAVRNMDEHWIDVHDPAVTALRVTNFSNYAPKRDGPAAIGVEYNASAGDSLSEADDHAMVARAREDLRRMRLIEAAPTTSAVVREPRAYPVYFRGYREVTGSLFAELAKVEGLVLAGRNALYKWNNMHHSVKTGLLAARNAMGSDHDLFAVRGNVTIGKDSD